MIEINCEIIFLILFCLHNVYTDSFINCSHCNSLDVFFNNSFIVAAWNTDNWFQITEKANGQLRKFSTLVTIGQSFGQILQQKKIQKYIRYCNKKFSKTSILKAETDNWRFWYTITVFWFWVAFYLHSLIDM